MAKNILELSYHNLRMILSYLEKAGSFRSCFDDLFGGSGAEFSLGQMTPTTEARPL